MSVGLNTINVVYKVRKKHENGVVICCENVQFQSKAVQNKK